MKRLFAILLVLGALGACSEDPVAPPGGPDPRPDTLGPLTSVPLSMGDRWTYDVTWTLRILTPEREEREPPEQHEAAVVKEIIATETLLEQIYLVERECWRIAPDDSVQSYRRFRQDGTGLYRLFADLSAAPGELDGITEADEIKRLEFPLDVETGWTNLGSSRSKVEAKERVKTATGEVEAYRIAVTSSRDRENDFVNVWFNQDGLVRRHNHYELNAIDVVSGDQVIVVTDEVEVMRTGPAQ